MPLEWLYSDDISGGGCTRSIQSQKFENSQTALVKSAYKFYMNWIQIGYKPKNIQIGYKKIYKLDTNGIQMSPKKVK